MVDKEIKVVDIPLTSERKIQLPDGNVLDVVEGIVLILNKLERIEKAVVGW